MLSGFTPADSSATIKMTAFDNDAISYQSQSNANSIALFSEIYYKDWNAYIDGKKANYFKANYVLRGLNVPAGKHTIEFKFEPQVVKTGSMIALISFIIMLILLGGGIYFERKKLLIQCIWKKKILNKYKNNLITS